MCGSVILELLNSCHGHSHKSEVRCCLVYSILWYNPLVRRPKLALTQKELRLLRGCSPTFCARIVLYLCAEKAKPVMPRVCTAALRAESGFFVSTSATVPLSSPGREGGGSYSKNRPVKRTTLICQVRDQILTQDKDVSFLWMPQDWGREVITGTANCEEGTGWVWKEAAQRFSSSLSSRLLLHQHKCFKLIVLLWQCQTSLAFNRHITRFETQVRHKRIYSFQHKLMQKQWCTQRRTNSGSWFGASRVPE